MGDTEVLLYASSGDKVGVGSVVGVGLFDGEITTEGRGVVGTFVGTDVGDNVGNTVGDTIGDTAGVKVGA